MRIPKSFYLRHHKQRWQVEQVRNSPLRRMGDCTPGLRRIRIMMESYHNGRKRTQAELSHTFWHEAVHAILHDMDNALWDNEAFVSAFAKRLAKLVDTAEV